MQSKIFVILDPQWTKKSHDSGSWQQSLMANDWITRSRWECNKRPTMYCYSQNNGSCLLMYINLKILGFFSLPEWARKDFFPLLFSLSLPCWMFYFVNLLWTSATMSGGAHMKTVDGAEVPLVCSTILMGWVSTSAPDLEPGTFP